MSASVSSALSGSPTRPSTRWSSGRPVQDRRSPRRAVPARRARQPACHARVPRAPSAARASSRSPRSSRQPPRAARPVRLSAQRLPRDAQRGDARARRRGGRRGRARGRSAGAPRAARRLRARASSLASARHRRAIPGAATAPAARYRISGEVSPSGAAVYHSVLRPTGAQYVALQEFGVGGGPEVKERTERGSRASSRRGARTDRAGVRQGVGHEDERPSAGLDRRRLDRLARARPRARDRRAAARPGRRDLRPGVLGQDDARLPRDRRGAAPRRDLRVHRRRARNGSAVTRNGSESISTICSSPSPTRASRRSRSPSC